MKRRSRFMIFLVTALVTIGTLAAAVGKPPYARHHWHMGQCEKAEPAKSLRP